MSRGDASPDGAVVFVDLTGMPGWGSEAKPDDPDTSTILHRHAASAGGEIRLVQGSMALGAFADATSAVAFAMDVLAEARASGGSAVAGAELASPVDDLGPGSPPARIAQALADLADPLHVLVTGRIVTAVGGREGFSFDQGPHATVDAEPIATFTVRRH